MVKTAKRIVGDWGEEQAALFLYRAGYEIIDRNYLTKGGEIDIIAWHTKSHFGRTLCFVEVKTRTELVDGSAERATDWKKLQHIVRAARHYCLTNNISLDRTPMQFEQVSIYAETVGATPQIYHYVIPIDAS